MHIHIKKQAKKVEAFNHNQKKNKIKAVLSKAQTSNRTTKNTIKQDHYTIVRIKNAVPTTPAHAHYNDDI